MKMLKNDIQVRKLEKPDSEGNDIEIFSSSIQRGTQLELTQAKLNFEEMIKNTEEMLTKDNLEKQQNKFKAQIETQLTNLRTQLKPLEEFFAKQ